MRKTDLSSFENFSTEREGKSERESRWLCAARGEEEEERAEELEEERK